MAILYWGRAGKFAAFMGGLTVLLDIAGPDRLRKLATYGRRFTGRYRALKPGESIDSRKESYPEEFFLLTLCAAGFYLSLLFARWAYVSGKGFPSAVLAAIVAVSTPGVPFLFILTVNLIVKILDSNRPAQAFRWTGVVLIAVGFHFDLLAS
ncbi:hypothetical protein ACQPZF_10435 [Actinosynnema sp. CS-041913]|uniref:hypothetical protein n=1 Tax=Actinosynnema sp. CS-041913 TaxID=3239917 RepID=UPI003D8CDBD2